MINIHYNKALSSKTFRQTQLGVPALSQRGDCALSYLVVRQHLSMAYIRNAMVILIV